METDGDKWQNKNYRLLVPDVRGFGDSAHPDDPKSSHTMGDLVQDMMCILDHEKVTSATCMGYVVISFVIEAFGTWYITDTTGEHNHATRPPVCDLISFLVLLALQFLYATFLTTRLLILCHLSFSTCLMQVTTHLSRIWFQSFQDSHIKCISMRGRTMQRKNSVMIQGGAWERLTVRFLALLQTIFWRVRPHTWMPGKMSKK